MPLASAAANALWIASALPERLRLGTALARVGETQEGLLLDLVRRNAASAFGRAHGFDAIRSLDGFRSRVPLARYDDLAPSIERIARGEAGVLTVEPVTRLVPTSGSTAATKRIPYTRSLAREMRRGIDAWIGALALEHPSAFRGPAYWGISPAVAEPAPSPGGIPIGFEDDAAYLGPIARRLQRLVQAVPAEVRQETGIDSFRRETLRHLVACRDLSLISVWSPSFLTLLMEPLRDVLPSLLPSLPRVRAREVERALGASDLHRRLWPRLALISCWGDGPSAPLLPSVERLFPGVAVQRKGLVATEAFVTLPWPGADGGLLAVRSHVVELLDGRGDAWSPHEARRGEAYEVVVTTGGGLHRYRLGDLVEVTGFVGQAPVLRFVGREAAVSDRFGEKLHEGHVRNVLARLFPEPPAFAMLAFDGAGYTLFLESRDVAPDLAEALDAALGENVHYRYARDLGQLAPPRLFRVEGRGLETYLAAKTAGGARLGDVKPSALERGDGWAAAFAGNYLGATSSAAASTSSSDAETPSSAAQRRR